MTLVNGLVPVQAIYDGSYSALLPSLPRAGGANSTLNSSTVLWNDVAALQSPQFPIYAIIGSGQPTLNSLVEPQTTPGCLVGVKGDGDGTVPIQSATNAAWISNMLYVNELHSDLPANDQVIIAIQDILQGRRPSNLSFAPFGVASSTTTCLNQ